MRRQNWSWVIVVVLLMGAAVYLGSPLMAVEELKSALQSRDRDKLERVVDFPGLRESLKSQFAAAMLAQARNDSGEGSDFAEGLAVLVGPALVDRAIARP